MSSSSSFAFSQTYYADAHSRNRRPLSTERFASTAEFGDCWRETDFPLPVPRPEDAMQFSLYKINEEQSHDR